MCSIYRAEVSRQKDARIVRLFCFQYSVWISFFREHDRLAKLFVQFENVGILVPLAIEVFGDAKCIQGRHHDRSLDMAATAAALLTVKADNVLGVNGLNPSFQIHDAHLHICIE